MPPGASSIDVMSGGFAVRVGDLLADRYRLDQRLGAGGMGEVWRGHDLNLERAVAVKVVLEAATNEELVARFRREATIGARLQHPGITVVHDVGQHDGRLFIVMELLAGEDLASVLARVPGGLPVDEALALAAQTAEALAAAHEQAVVHRDLKPGNLFLLPAGRLKICDFGIAHSADATAGWTVTGRVFGSPPYMAPEQWRGERVDARCDLYALGCVLYALLSGQPPFGAAETLYVLMRRHVEDSPRPLGLAPELDRLVLALLAKDPADRPESAQAVGKVLRGLMGAGSAGAGELPVYVPTVVEAATPAWGEAAGAEAVPDLVRELLLEAEEALRGASPGREHVRVEALAVAADVAARFDAGLAGRLLAAAEHAAWTDAEGNGARVADRLAFLARQISRHAPARAERLLTDAEQALFTVFGSNRQAPLRAVAEELSELSPERAARLAERHFAGHPLGDRLRVGISTAFAAADPEGAGERLGRIEDPALRVAVAADLAVAVARRDLPAALRIGESAGSAADRLTALCRVAGERAAAGDTAGAAQALERAERSLPPFLEERAGRLREESALHARQGSIAAAERLRTQAAGLLGGRPEDTGDPETDQALAALATARMRVERGAEPLLDPARARERAADARALAEPADRARALAHIARDSVATGRAPWLAEAAADPGTPPPRGTAVAVSSESARPGTVAVVAPGRERWHTGARPASLHAAGDSVVWRVGEEVGSVRADTGATCWTAFADEGVPAPPLSGATAVSCAADAGAVYVAVERRERPGVRLLAREPQDGRVRWWLDLPEARPRDVAALTVADGMVLLGSRGELTAVDAASGEAVWRRPVQGGGSGRLTVAGDCLVLADGLLLTGLHLSTGQALWSWPRNEYAGGPQLPGGPVHVLDGDCVRALHRRDGRELWRFEAGTTAPRLLASAGTVYAAAYRPEQGWDMVFALDSATGEVRWQRPMTRRDGTVCALELLGTRQGVLYVKSARGGRRGLLGRPAQPFVSGLDAATGRPLWHWEDPAVGDLGAVLAGDNLVLPLPALTAIALP